MGLLTGLRVVLGGLLAVAGAALFLWTQAVRGRAGAHPEVPIPRRPGPVPLLTRGPYAICRHPMLLGALALLLGIGLLRAVHPDAAAVLAGLAAAAVLLTLLEERGLRRRHGADYHQYCSQVPFLIPRVRRRR